MQLPIFQMLYVSGAVGPVSESSIDQILATSRRNNAVAGITGLLLVADEIFVQVLEGDREAVLGLASRIRADRRHRNFMVLVETQAAERAFGAWHMGFKRLDPGRAEDQVVFRATAAAINQRIGRADGGLMLHAVLAFGRDMIASD
ncbi:MAG: BLUF domain-containing protein [Mesorhizobium sp.]|nr:BLUF domain-containing protein [Mesorhizobium sp.]